MPPFGPQLVHAIKRNFGGLEDKNIDPVEEFLKRLPSGQDRTPDLRNISPEVSTKEPQPSWLTCHVNLLNGDGTHIHMSIARTTQ